MLPLDISKWTSVEAWIEFTPIMEPSTLAAGGLELVSLVTEIAANMPTEEARRLRRDDGGIPYSAPLYSWEAHVGGQVRSLYIGQTVDLSIQRRFESHAKVMRLLARYVNDPAAHVFFRLCSRFDIAQGEGDSRKALEWLDPVQAAELVTDVESMLIFERQPDFNVHYKRAPRTPWKPIVIKSCVFG